jgi:monoamine oxidase
METGNATLLVNGNGPQHGLKIIVIGAGIGGLSAAINLAKQGHKITVSD